MSRQRDPYPSAFDGDVTLCDAPILVGLTATGRLSQVLRLVPDLRYALPARAEMSQLWVDGVNGAADAVDINGIDLDPTDSADPAVRAGLFEQIDSLTNAWLGGQLDEAGVRSAATTFVVARHRRVALLTNRYPHWSAGMPRNGPRRVLCVGTAELALWLARSELGASDAWAFYCELARTIAGEQPGWPVGEAEADFGYWAEEAAADRL